MAPVWSNVRTGVGMTGALVALALVLVLATAPSSASAKPAPWPPADGPGELYVHFGEEHINDADGGTLLPKVVRESARYRPRLVTMSGDKADNGEPEQFELWSAAIEHYDRRSIPWFAGVGNHDRDAGLLPGGTNIVGDFGPYRDFFADRPYPMGDASGYARLGIRPRSRPGSDPQGAASHYFVDAGPVRWIFLDNSCWSIVACNNLQNPSGQSPAGEAQLDFLGRVAGRAEGRGRLVFVVMHMPTQDPGDQLYRDPIALAHTMGKGPAGLLDNTLFELAAEQSGVDGVFVAHIKGQFRYEGEGGVPYFIDGGAGGGLYTTGPVGTDHGFWHGFRVITVERRRFRTDAVPIFVRNGIEIEGPRTLRRGSAFTFEAFGRQPVFNDPAKVPALELRDPEPTPRGGAAGAAWLGDAVRWLLPLASLPLAFLLAALARSPRRRRLAVPALVALAGLGLAGVSMAQQSEPTSTPVESLPNPARMWTTSDPLVLRPVASESDDPRRNGRTQTADGRFRAACPGKAKLTLASGFESASARVGVPSGAGPIVRSLRPGAATIERGRSATLARVGLEQPARVVATVRRHGHRVARLHRACERPGNIAIRWDGSGARRHGGYRVDVGVLSDRRPVRRAFPFELER
jgi:hypothetical protein